MTIFDQFAKPLSVSKHDSIEHSIGEELPAPSMVVPSGSTSALGSSAVAAREDHSHNVDMDLVSPVVAYVPGTSGFTSFASYTAYYQVIGKRCFVSFRAFTPVFNGATPGIGYPSGFAPNNDIEIDSSRSVLYYDANGAREYGCLYLFSTYLGLLVDTVSGSHIIGGLPSATNPFTWASPDFFSFSVNYRLA